MHTVCRVCPQKHRRTGMLNNIIIDSISFKIISVSLMLQVPSHSCLFWPTLSSGIGWICYQIQCHMLHILLLLLLLRINISITFFFVVVVFFLLPPFLLFFLLLIYRSLDVNHLANLRSASLVDTHSFFKEWK